MEFAQSLPALQGVQRIADNTLSYSKKTYLPQTWDVGSVLYIIGYTILVFFATEVLLRGKLTRWLYLGSVLMVGSLLYRGEVSLIK